MFLERFGRLLFSKIRPSFFYSLLALPPLLTLAYLLALHSDWQSQEELFAAAAAKSKSAIERKLRSLRLIQLHSHADPYFLDQEMENLALLEKEKTQLESLVNHPALSDKGALQERLAFIATNHLAFSEENLSSSSNLKEVRETQRYPVEVDAQDLAKLCALVENVQVDSQMPAENSPQLIFLKFDIKKAENPFQFNNYELQTEILKREWTN